MGLFRRRRKAESQTAVHPNQRIVERYMNEAFLGGSREALEATVSHEGRIHEGLTNRGFSFLEGVPRVWNAFADRRGTIELPFTSPDGQWVGASFTMEARHVGPWLSIQPTGKTVTLRGTALYRLTDGKISDVWVTWNWLPLVQ
jgi:predicted ester cyclase